MQDYRLEGLSEVRPTWYLQVQQEERWLVKGSYGLMAPLVVPSRSRHRRCGGQTKGL